MNKTAVQRLARLEAVLRVRGMTPRHMVFERLCGALFERVRGDAVLALAVRMEAGTFTPADHDDLAVLSADDLVEIDMPAAELVRRIAAALTKFKEQF